jgi:hypothetical protein
MDKNRKPPELAFTAGPFRVIADQVQLAIAAERERVAKEPSA